MGKVLASHIDFFYGLLGENGVKTDTETIESAASDETEDLVYYPEVVLCPENEIQVSEILKYCNQNKIPVTPRGAGTGLSGGALPIKGGVVIWMKRFNKILKIDTENFQAIAEPGVINEDFQNKVKEFGLFYPPDPASKGSCFLGGNVAHSSGGPRAVKYGTTRNYILNLEVVLPTGEIIWTGANTLKYSTGYNLTHLFIGSEGTLGIITKIVLQLIPLPKHNVLMLVPFKNQVEACKAVSEIFMLGITPSALEFMERDAIDWVMKFKPELSMQVNEDIQAKLLIELDGNNEELLRMQAEEIFNLLTTFDTEEILYAEDAASKEKLWKLRRSIAEAVKANSVYKEEDTVVPRAALPELLSGVKEIGKRYGFNSVCYGHAGDGNLHVNIIKGNLSDEFWKNEIHTAIEEIFALCKKLGGTISGEHGIGLVQKRYMHIVQNNVQIELQRGIKKVFDPNNILNPEKIF